MKPIYLIVGAILAAMILIQPSGAVLSGYAYEQVVNITGTDEWTGDAYNQQLNFIIDDGYGVSSGAHIYLNDSASSWTNLGGKNLINDLRFCDAEETLYDYWIEDTASNNTYWSVWVEVPLINKTTASKMYIDYGNPSATSYQNGDNTFLFFDHFTEATLNLTKWNSTSVTSSLSGSLAALTGDGYGIRSNTSKFGKFTTLMTRATGSRQADVVTPVLSSCNGSDWGTDSWGGNAVLVRHDALPDLFASVTTGGTGDTTDIESNMWTEYHVFRIIRRNTDVYFDIDYGTWHYNELNEYTWTSTNGVSTQERAIHLGGGETAHKMYYDWALAMNYTSAANITSSAAGPIADFTANVTSGTAPLTVLFTDYSSGTPTYWDWGFGDGVNSSDQNPTYTYSTPGTYTVSLDIGNADGTSSRSRVDYITVSEQNRTGYGIQYPPQSVTLHFQTVWGAPIEDATVTIQGYETTTGSWDWLGTLLGIPLAETPIHNTEMTGSTDTNGDIQFMMVPSVKYNVSVVSTQMTQSFTIIPTDSRYVFIGTAFSFLEDDEDILSVMSIAVTGTELNATGANITITASDTGAKISGGLVLVNKTVNTTAWGESTVGTYTVPAANFTKNFTVLNHRGESYIVRVNITRTGGDNVIRDYAIAFPKEKTLPFGMDSRTAMIMSMGILIIVGMAFTATTAEKGPLITCFVGWVLLPTGLMDYAGVALMGSILTAATFLSILIIIAAYRRENG